MKPLRQIVSIEEGKKWNAVKSTAKDHRNLIAGSLGGAAVGYGITHLTGIPAAGNFASAAGSWAGWALDDRRKKREELLKKRKEKKYPTSSSNEP